MRARNRVARGAAWGVIAGVLGWPWVGTAGAVVIAAGVGLLATGLLVWRARPPRASVAADRAVPPRRPARPSPPRTGPWHEVSRLPVPSPARVAPVLIPVLLVALLIGIGRPVLAGVLAIALVALFVVGLVAPGVRARVERLGARIGTVASRLVAGLLLGMVMVLVIAPARFLTWLVGRDPLDLGRGRWAERAAGPPDPGRRTFGVEPTARRSPWVGVALAVPTLFGWLVVLGAANYVLGLAWDRLTDDSVEGSPADVVATGAPDPRADSVGFRDVPWAADYLAELATARTTYRPYVYYRMGRFEGRYINTDADGVRRTRRGEGFDADEAVEIWMFGGSTIWGEGQRDGHTVPSEVTRLAESEGLPVRIVNFGERGYVAYQEYLLFEQELALREPPDLAVFYDGTNDYNVWTPEFNDDDDRYAGSPPTYHLEAYRAAMGGASDDVEDPDLVDRYLDHSLAHDIVDELRSLFGGDEAEAQEVPLTEDEAQLTENVVGTYLRSRRLVELLAADRGVATTFFWQPQGPNAVYEAMAARLAPGTIDVSDALVGHEDVFIDGGHTNEEGARLVAEAIWPYLEPQVRELSSAG